MQAFRFADRRFPIFDGTGARLIGGRWNSPGRAVIYAAETFSGALLEVLVHANLARVPRTHDVMEIAIPDTVSVEYLRRESLPGWEAEDQSVSRAFGDRWLQEQRSAVLLVPGAVTCGRERNILINPAHRNFRQIAASLAEDVQWGFNHDATSGYSAGERHLNCKTGDACSPWIPSNPRPRRGCAT